MPKQTKCRCWIRHALTAKERAIVTDGLEYARSIGDRTGVILATAQLGSCKSQPEEAIPAG